MSSYPPTVEHQLFDAAQRGDEPLVSSLLKVSDLRPNNAVDATTGWSALAAALIGGHSRCADVLVDAGAVLDASVDHRGNGVLHACAAGASSGDSDEVGLNVARRLLSLEDKARVLEAVNAPNHEGVTAMHLAAQRGKRKLIALLAEAGASLDAKDRAGRDPYHYRADAPTERLLLELISERAVKAQSASSARGAGGRDGVAAPGFGGHSVAASALPWNLNDPGRTETGREAYGRSPKFGTTVEQHHDAPKRGGSSARSGAGASTKFAGGAAGYRPPPLVTGPPPPPNTFGEKPSHTRAPDAKTLAGGRAGNALTAEQERRASYLNVYFADDGPKGAAKRAAKRGAKAGTRRPGGLSGESKPVSSGAGVSKSQRSSGYGQSAPEKNLSLEEKLKRAFRTADVDGSRSVSKRELYRALEKAGITAFSTPEGLKLFNEHDADGDGQLGYDEFAQLARKLRPLLEKSVGESLFDTAMAEGRAAVKGEHGLSRKTRQQLRRAFAAFDADGSGWISISELNGALRKCGMYVGDEQLRRMFDEADLDRSGGIDLEEFETLVERLMTPSRILGADDGRSAVPPPQDGSAVAAVFAAFAKGTTGFMATRQLPQALRLLGLNPEDPRIVACIEDASHGSGGVLGRHAFSVLVHKLLRGDFSRTVPPPPGEVAALAASAARPESKPRLVKAGSHTAGWASPTGRGASAGSTNASPIRAATKGGGSRGGGAGGGVGGGTAAEGTGAKRVTGLAPLSREDEPDARKRLARAFVLCESEEGGTIAARDVPDVLWQAGILTDRSLVDTMRPKPNQAGVRVSFEKLVSMAFALDPPSTAGSPTKRDGRGATRPPLMLRIVDLTLAPWLVAHPSVHTVSVVLRGGVLHTEARTGATTPSKASEPVPLVLRTPTCAKQPAPIAIELEARLPAGTAYVHLELQHEPVPGSGALTTLARADLELDRLYAGASYPLPYTVPLFDSRAVQAAALQLVATRLEGHSNPPSPALSPVRGGSARAAAGVQMAMAPAGSHEAEVASLTTELARLRERNANLRQQQSVMSVQLRAGQRAHTAPSASHAAHAASSSLSSPFRRGGIGEPSRSPGTKGAETAGATADWRLASVSSLDRTLAHLRKSAAGRHGGAAEMALGLERSRDGLAQLAASASFDLSDDLPREASGGRRAFGQEAAQADHTPAVLV